MVRIFLKLNELEKIENSNKNDEKKSKKKQNEKKGLFSKKFFVKKEDKNKKKSQNIKEKEKKNGEIEPKKKGWKKYLIIAFFGLLLISQLIPTYPQKPAHKKAQPNKSVEKINSKPYPAKEEETEEQINNSLSVIQPETQPDTKPVNTAKKKSENTKEKPKTLSQLQQKMSKSDLKNVSNSINPKRFYCKNLLRINNEIIYFIKDNKNKKFIPVYVKPDWDGKGIVFKPFEVKEALKKEDKYFEIEKGKYILPDKSVKCYTE
jgi:chemotaxis protein histidine kinase CheA